LILYVSEGEAGRVVLTSRVGGVARR